MGRARRVGGIGLFVLFLGGIALRPLLSNPAVFAAVREGLDGWQALVSVPLVVLTLFVTALRVRSLLADGADEGGTAPTPVAPADDGPDEPSREARTAGDTDGTVTPSEDRTSELAALRPDDPETGIGADILTGRDGVPGRAERIEAVRPDARLSDHLEHLRAELEGDQTVARDLETLETVTREFEDSRTVPARCPETHCDAVWTGRTVLGIATDQYELLNDGERVQCLRCESVVELE